MKADEPRVPVAKYGMPIEEAPHIVRRHFQVLGEEQAIHAARMAHNIRVGPAVRAALDRGSVQRVATPTMPVQPAPEAVSAISDGLRARLGLS